MQSAGLLKTGLHASLQILHCPIVALAGLSVPVRFVVLGPARDVRPASSPRKATVQAVGFLTLKIIRVYWAMRGEIARAAGILI